MLKKVLPRKNFLNNVQSIKYFNYRLVMLVILTILPIFALMIWASFVERANEVDNAQENLTGYVEIISSNQERLLASSQQLLGALAAMPEIKQATTDSDHCRNFLTSNFKNYDQYSNFGVVGPDGNVICSILPSAHGMNFSDRKFFSEAKNGDFSIGEYIVDSVTGNGSIIFAYPVDTTDGQRAVIFTSLDLKQLEQMVSRAHLPAGSSATILDRDGTVIMRYPEQGFIGKPAVDTEIGQTMLDRKQGFAVVKGLDNVERAYAFDDLTGTSADPDAYIAIGVPTALLNAQANRDLVRNMAILLIIAAFTVYLAVITGKVLILKQVQLLQDINRMKGEFVSLVSHQIKNPLTAVKLQIGLLTSDPDLSAEQRSSIGELDESVDEILLLANKFLEAQKIEATAVELRHDLVDLKEFSRRILQEMTPQMNAKSIKLEQSFPRHDLETVVDPFMIKQAITNLLSNAVKYTPAGGRIRFKLEGREKEVRFEISDSGIGIPRREQTKIFENYYRGTNAQSGRTKGTGMGLYFAKRIVEASGGRIGFSSKEGVGSTFWFTLPLRRSDRKM